MSLLDDNTGSHNEGDSLRYADPVSTSPDAMEVFGNVDHHPSRSSAFDTSNVEAVPVYERASNSFLAYAVTLGANPQRVVGRHLGRRYVTLSVPTTYTYPGLAAATPLGVVVGGGPNSVVTNGYQLNPGDSIEIDSEAEVWAAPISGNSSGLVQVLEVFHSLGGPAGH